jgi:hypothetical protein
MVKIDFSLKAAPSKFIENVELIKVLKPAIFRLVSWRMEKPITEVKKYLSH